MNQLRSLFNTGPGKGVRTPSGPNGGGCPSGDAMTKTSQKVKLGAKGDRCVYKDAAGQKVVRVDGRYLSLQAAKKACAATSKQKQGKP